MTPIHMRWKEFVDALEEGLAPEFDQDGNLIRWWCRDDHRQCVDALRGMGLGFDEVEASLAYFRGHGGGCDCEVMFNVVIDSVA